MMRWESSLQKWLRNNALALGYIAAALIGLFIRYQFMPYVSIDLAGYNIPWYNAIKTYGAEAIADPSLRFNYMPSYIYYMCLCIRLLPNVRTGAVLKVTGVVVELCFSVMCFILCSEQMKGKCYKLRRFVAFVIICINPIAIINGSCWGQTDAFYALFCIAAIIMYLREKPVWSIVMLSLAFSWKQQAVFLLPLFIILYFCGKKRFSALWFLLIPAIVVISGFPMILVGQSPLFAVEIYREQIGAYTKLTCNCPNMFALMGETTNETQMVNGMLSRTGIALCVVAIGGMAVWLIGRRALVDGRELLLLGAWCVLCCIFFLPRMHDRYGFVGETLLMCWAVCEMKPRGFAYVLLGMLATLSVYSDFLLQNPFFPLQFGSVLNLVLFCALTYELRLSVRLKSVPTDKTQVHAEKGYCNIT